MYRNIIIRIPVTPFIVILSTTYFDRSYTNENENVLNKNTKYNTAIICRKIGFKCVPKWPIHDAVLS